MTNNIQIAIKEANTSLPQRKLDELIERTNLSADMKALLSDIAKITVKVTGKIISIGRKVLSVVFEFVKLFPGITLGVIAALVITAIIASVPVIGGVLAGALSSILLLIGVGKGALLDLTNSSLNQKIDNFIASIAALKDA